MLLNKPDDPVPHILEILERMSGIGKTPLTKQENVELGRLREEYKQLKAKSKNMKKDKINAGEAVSSDSEQDHDNTAAKADAGSSSDSEGEEEEHVAELTPAMAKSNFEMAKKARQSVSAEVFGRWNKKQAFQAKIVPKSEETTASIRKRVENSFMFNNLDDKDFNIII